jgi:chromosome segregation ATPase
MSEQTARLVARLRDRLQRTTRRMTWAELAFGIVVAVGAVAGGWLVATLLEASLWLGTAARTALAAAIGTVAVGIGGALLARPLGQLVGLLSGPSEETVARKVGQHHPSVADRLVNLLQLAEGKRSHAPAPLVDQAVQNLADDLDDVSFDEVEDFGRARQALRLASLPLAGVLAFLLVAPSAFLGASERLLAPATEFERPASFQLTVTPGDARLVQGDSLQIAVRATGASPPAVTLQFRDSTGQAAERIRLTPDSTGTFRHVRPSVRESFRYRVHAPPLRTDWNRVTVVNRPLVRRLQLTVTPPSYTGRPSRDLAPNVGDVTALPGSRIAVSATLGGPPVDSARITFDDGRTRSLSVTDNTAEGRFRLRREGSYTVRLHSRAGTTNRDPIRYQTAVQADARPSVSFLQPTGPVNLDADLRHTLRVQLSDDYGFSRAALFYRMSKERFGEGQSEYASVPLALPNADNTTLELTHEWLLAQDTGLDPEPGDVVSYYVKAWDNDTVNGPKSGRTATQRLHMPSLTEEYEQLEETQNEADTQMRQLRERADSVQQQFRQLRRELRRTRKADWQDRRQLDRIQQKQQSVEQGVEKLSRQVEKMNRQMQQSGLSSPETMQKFEELQRVVEEINSPELRKALDKLRKAMQNNDLRQMQRAMEQVQKNEQSYQEQLDRTLSLFKQLKAQQKLDEMARRAGELSELEKTLREKTRERMQDESSPAPSDETAPSADSAATGDTERSKTSSNDPSTAEKASSSQQSRPPSDSTAASRRSPQADSASGTPRSPKAKNEDLAREQERAAEQMRKLMEEMDKARREMKEVQSAPQKQLQRMQQQLQRRNLPKQMQKNSQQLRQNRLQDAQQGQQRMQQQLSQMQQQLSKMKSQMQGQKRRINVAGLRTALANTLRLSKRQETLRQKISDLATQSPTLRSFARDQKTLSDGLTTVADSLQALAKRVPEMTREVEEKTGNAHRAMETATTALDERDANRAAGHQKTSMMHLNELALLLSDLLEKLQNQQGSGSGMSMQQMMQKLKQMSGQQQKLNSQIQQHLNRVQGNRLSKDQAQRQKELARQQRQIQKQLQEMNAGSKAKSQIMGDLQKIAEQMEQTAQQLEQGRHSRDLLDRQKQILTRLLNAQKSLRTQGKQQQRKGREANDDYDQRRPGPLPDTEEEANKLRRDLMRALEMGYSPDYEELIKRYFELLEKRESTSRQ